MEKNKKYVVTITRQFGSLGRPIARLMSQKLGIDYFDRGHCRRGVEETEPPCLADRRTGRKSGKVDEKRIYENDVSPGNTGEQRPGQSV